jgi:hypothetical protein
LSKNKESSIAKKAVNRAITHRFAMQLIYYLPIPYGSKTDFPIARDRSRISHLAMAGKCSTK